MGVKSVVKSGTVFWPSILLVVLFAVNAIASAGGLTPVAIIGLLGLQLVWVALWYGVPAGVRKLGEFVGNRSVDK